MKPTGPIPVAYTERDGQLLIGGQTAETLIERAGGSPLFVYDNAIVRDTVQKLREAMPPDLALHYAMKANPYVPLLRVIVPMVDGIDIASGGELAMALDADADAAHISFAGPGKRDDELSAALLAGATINLESKNEAERALSLATGLNIRPRLAIRVNPDFDLRGSGMKMGGGAKPFGVDADRAAALARHVIDAGADWRGWHIFAGSQALDPLAVIEAQRQTVALAARLSEAVGSAPPLVNIGGGFGVPYFSGDLPLDILAIGRALEETLAKRPDILRTSAFALELGRYLVAEAGVYLTRVIDVKSSHGENFAIVDGGLHHQLAASGNFGTVVRRNYPIAVANKFHMPHASDPVSVVGCLCTPLDRLGDKVSLPPVEPGDIIAIFLAGAYGATASPAAFLGHPAPHEMLLV